MSQNKDKVILVQWENYASGVPSLVTLTDRASATRNANAFRMNRRRRADILPATRENLALLQWTPTR